MVFNVTGRRRHRKVRVATGLLCVSFFVPLFVMRVAPVHADRGVSIVSENDFYGGFDGDLSDRFYSNGLAASYRRSGQNASGLAKRLADRAFGPSAGDPKRLVVEGFGFAHSFFTPDGISEEEPQPLDHPYAGYLRATYDWTVRHGETIDSTQIAVGLVGPLTGAEEIQSFWHSVLNDTNPQGWDNQLENEPVIQAAWQRKWPRWTLFEHKHIGSDARPVTEINLGNAFVNGSVGGEVRLGHRLGDEFGAPRIGPEAPSTGFLEKREDIAWFLYAGLDLRGAGRNLFIQGNTFRDSVGRDLEHFVTDYKGGVVVQTPRFEVGLTYVSRAQEFDTQDGRHTFGFASLAATF